VIISKTPLRVSFAGGGTDFATYYRQKEGSVLSTCIDKYIYVMVKERFDDKIVAHYRKTEIVDTPDELEHELIREVLKMVGIKKKIEISTTADIPSEGSGLGSSSAVTVGLLNALYHYIGELPTKEELAKNACKIEIDILKSPIGKQDQHATAFGGFNLIIFHQDDTVSVQKVDVPKEFEENLILFHIDLPRNSYKILRKQVLNIKEKMGILSEMANIAKDMQYSLASNNFDNFAYLLDKEWLLKKTLAPGITNETIEEVYNIALSNGAMGGKLCGGGGGGFFLIFCPKEKQWLVRNALKSFKELPFRFEKLGSHIIFDGR